jgi:hypothetical protein
MVHPFPPAKLVVRLQDTITVHRRITVRYFGDNLGVSTYNVMMNEKKNVNKRAEISGVGAMAATA